MDEMHEMAVYALKGATVETVDTWAAEMRNAVDHVVRKWVDALPNVTPEQRRVTTSALRLTMLAEALGETVADGPGTTSEDFISRGTTALRQVREFAIAKYRAMRSEELAAAQRRLGDAPAGGVTN